MSTLKVSAIQDASGGNTATINSMTPTADSLQGFRNRIINGDMRIDQRNAGASVTPAQDNYMTDRFKWGQSQSSKFTAQQSTTAPSGFTNSLLMTVTSAVTIGSSDYFSVYQPIEGLNVADLGWGTANAKTVTLSFWVRSSLTGTFGGSLRNNTGTRSYPYSYTISSANTWEYKTITISGDTTGTWLTTNGVGMFVQFSLGVGTTLSGTAGAWAGANYLSATGAVSVVGTNGATFFITGVQLEVGSTATPFERRPYGTELALCQRYFTNYQDAFLSVKSFSTVDGNFISNPVPYPVTMRATPTITVFDLDVASGKAHIQYNGSGGGSNVTVTTTDVTNKAFMVNKSSGVGNDKYGTLIFKYNAAIEL